MSEEKQEDRASAELSEEDKKEMELFIQNSQNYCQKIYGKTFGDEELDELRKEFKDTAVAITNIKKGWE